jgi:DUF4097 and DUF4098 domain-containing protein YvlB
MKRTFALLGCTWAVCVLARAQEVAADRIVVPERNGSRPRVVEVTLVNGSITVKTHGDNRVIVETGRRESHHPRTVEGLHRLDLPPNRLDVEEEDNVVRIHSHDAPSTGLTITVPLNTSLRLKSTNGRIHVEGVHGEIDASAVNGRVELLNVSGTVVTDSHNGAIRVVMDRVEPGKPISFSSFNGDLDVTLPADFKSNVKVWANHGKVYSDFDILLTGALTERSGSAEGRYRLTLDRIITGTINGGGTEASFRSFNGQIWIRKK